MGNSSKTTDSLFGEIARGDEFQTLHLAKVCGVSEHVDEKQFRHIPVPVRIVFVFESRSDRSAFFCDNVPLVRSSFARTNCSDELPENQCQLCII